LLATPPVTELGRHRLCGSHGPKRLLATNFVLLDVTGIRVCSHAHANYNPMTIYIVPTYITNNCDCLQSYCDVFISYTHLHS
jgi:hypothetical protein